MSYGSFAKACCIAAAYMMLSSMINTLLTIVVLMDTIISGRNRIALRWQHLLPTLNIFVYTDMDSSQFEHEQ